MPCSSQIQAPSQSKSRLKMAIQFWAGKNKPEKQRFISLRNGYHGDTFGAMSVCDPVTGMHTLFSEVLAKQLFITAPQTPFGEACNEEDLNALTQALETHHQGGGRYHPRTGCPGCGRNAFLFRRLFEQGPTTCRQLRRPADL